MSNSNGTTAERGRSLLAAAIETGRPVTLLGVLTPSPCPEAAYFEAMEIARGKAFSKPFQVGASNAPGMGREDGSPPHADS